MQQGIVFYHSYVSGRLEPTWNQTFNELIMIKLWDRAAALAEIEALFNTRDQEGLFPQRQMSLLVIMRN